MVQLTPTTTMTQTATLTESLPPETSLGDYLEVLKRRRKPGLLAAAIVLLIALLLSLLLPSIYRSRAVILIEQQEIPSELVRSTVTSFADQRIQMISQRVMTTSNLSEIMQRYDLYTAERRTQTREAVLARMRENVALEMISADVVDPRSGKAATANIAFSLSFDHESPSVAQRVANEIVSLFLAENLKSRAEMAEQTSSFLAEEANKLRTRVQDLEGQLARFKEANIDALPELMNMNLDLRVRAENELLRVEQQIASLHERRIFLEAQLAQISPSDAVYSESGQRLLGPGDRLKELQLQLVNLTSRYGESHPDVVNARREIEGLQAEAATRGDDGLLRAELAKAGNDLAAARERYGADHPDVRALERRYAGLEQQLSTSGNSGEVKATVAEANNPAYIQLRAQLTSANIELAAAEAKAKELHDNVASFTNRLASSPRVEGEYRALTREYEASLAKYREISAKQLEAEVSQSLETERKGERFTLIEPPLLPEQPARPNRLAILLLGFVLSAGAGIGTIATMEGVDDKVRGRRGVMALIGEPPLGAVPHIGSAADRVRSRLQTRHLLTYLVPAAVVALLLLIHFTYRPLDTLFFIILRKLGL